VAAIVLDPAPDVPVADLGRADGREDSGPIMALLATSGPAPRVLASSDPIPCDPIPCDPVPRDPVPRDPAALVRVSTGLPDPGAAPAPALTVQ